MSDFIQKEILEEERINKGRGKDKSLDVPPVILFLDNVYMMDKASWELLANLKKSCKRIGFVLLIKINPNNQPIFSSGADEVAIEFLSFDDNNDIMIDLSNLEEDELKALLCDFSKQYEMEMKDEINKMCEIADPKNSTLSHAEATKLKNEMIKSYNVADYFTDIQKDVMNVIIQKCEGNPLCSMQFVINLMASGLVATKDKVLYPNGKKFFE